MERYKYVCRPADGGCGNEIHAESVDRRLRGTKRHVRVTLPVTCECGTEMHRESYTPERPGPSRR